MNRLAHDPRTHAYRDRRKAQGKTKPDIIRCLKRYTAQEIYDLITNPPTEPKRTQPPAAPTQTKLTPKTVAKQPGTWPNQISELERGLHHNTDLAVRYHHRITTHQPN